MSKTHRQELLSKLDPAKPVLIAGPTASGKSGLAIEIAQSQGGVIVNADASQVYDCWRLLTARPSAEEERQAPHALYGHISEDQPYSVGHWLREVSPLLRAKDRPILVGGTGLYFKALTVGLADIPQTPPELRQAANDLPLYEMIATLDAPTKGAIDLANRVRVQRAWEVLHNTGKGLRAWQLDTPAPLLPLGQCHAIALDVERDWLNQRIKTRFDLMVQDGVLDEVRDVRPRFDPSLPAHRAIGAPELMQYLDGHIALADAVSNAVTATRQYAKRQRTWVRSNMQDWIRLPLPDAH